ncbi:hypothetical protein ILUMI_24228 [Ignelater luminosus]|uniref:Uncharacterized protein n=1 Tax=Ignelater luminosus TaxID=2038154 RepID=A0A8K0CAM1_IGNLU|nr:hypothetical protein ILUMI_24228 [Ignelater luminosus]
MEITLLTISKQCSDIINTCPLVLPLDNPILSELYDRIYDLYPALDTAKYKLYWRYNKDTFHQISDYLSYITVVALMADKTLILVLNDCDEHCDENEAFLRKLDKKELEEQRERERDIYDVKIIRKGEEPVEESDESDDELPTEPRTDSQIITYAIRKLPETKYFTSDLLLKSNLIRDVQKGWPKLKNKLTQLDEEVIERAVERNASKKGVADKKKKK